MYNPAMSARDADVSDQISKTHREVIGVLGRLRNMSVLLSLGGLVFIGRDYAFVFFVMAIVAAMGRWLVKWHAMRHPRRTTADND